MRLGVSVRPLAEALALGDLPATFLPYVSEIRDEERRAERRAGLLMLAALYRERTKEEPPPITVGKYGKPRFVEGSYSFSISHAGGMVAVALADEEIGLDLEPYASMTPRRAARFSSLLTEGERAEVAASRDPARTTLEIFVRKEAAVKKSGEGLAGIRAIDTSRLPPRYETHFYGGKYYLCVY